MGIQAGDRIAVLTEQRPEAVAAYTAIFSVGAIAVPLPPECEADGLAARLQDASIRIAIVDAACASNLLLAQSKYPALRSEEHTSELQSLMRNSYAVFCLKKKNKKK